MCLNCSVRQSQVDRSNITVCHCNSRNILLLEKYWTDMVFFYDGDESIKLVTNILHLKMIE